MLFLNPFIYAFRVEYVLVMTLKLRDFVFSFEVYQTDCTATFTFVHCWVETYSIEGVRYLHDLLVLF